MKIGKEIEREMKRLGLKSEDRLLEVLRKMSSVDVLLFDDSNTGMLVVGDRDVFGDRPNELLDISKKAREKLDEKRKDVISYTIERKMLDKIIKMLNKDFHKKEREMDEKIRNARVHENERTRS